MGQDLPVYLLITKADLLAGFREYFLRSTDAESDQVFGSTAPESFAAAAAIFVLATGAWAWGYFRNAALIDKVYAAANACYAEGHLTQ